MEFSYSREQQMVKKMLKEFAEKEIAPISAEIDEKAIYPYEAIGKCCFVNDVTPKNDI